MAQLNVFLLGPPRIELDHVPMDLPRRKILALFVYLTVTRQQHRRDALAALFWPEAGQAAARAALRRELHDLNQTLGNEWLAVERDTVAINETADVWVDTQQFRLHLEAYRTHNHDSGPICAACQESLTRAVTLYRGDFLAGFTLAGCPAFDDWQFFETDTLRRDYASTLERLVRCHRDRGEYETAIDYARRWKALDGLHEPAHRELMRLFAVAGQHSAAIRQYEECVRILEQELGVTPEVETTALYEAIRVRRFPNREPGPSQADPTISTPQMQLRPSANSPATNQIDKGGLPPLRQRVKDVIPLVGRNEEWQQLLAAWDKTLEKGVHCIVIAGEAGIGKTRLAEEMLAWAGEQGTDTAYARSYAAQGELAYVPLVALLRTAPLQHRLAQLGAVWLPHVARLLPELLETYPDLPAPESEMDSWQRQQLFEALAHTFRAVSQPLLLVLDDLQWCDRETLAWLQYLVTSTRNSLSQPTDRTPLLVVGTIRTGEPGNAQLLQRLLGGLRHADLLTHLALTRLNAADTVALATQIAARPLEPGFVELLQQNTEGNPLFIVETVRAGVKHWPADADAQRQLLADPSAASVPDLPPKVYAVIQWRLAQLSPQAQEIAGLAAVIGRSFSFDLLSAASQLDEETLAMGLDELWERQIIREQSTDAYDFSHDRIRDVAYSQVKPARRRLLHRRIVDALEITYADRLDSVSAALATQCEQAGLTKRALEYYARAASAAQRVGAYHEGVALIQRALALLETTPDTLEKLALELAFQLQLSPLQRIAVGYSTSALGQTLARARTLCQRLNKQESLHHVLIGLFTHKFGRAEMLQSKMVAEELLALAQSTQEPMALMEGHYVMGCLLFALGNFEVSHIHFEKSLVHDDPSHHQENIAFFGFNLNLFACSFHSHTLWMLGRPEQALQTMQATVAQARSLAHPFSLALTLAYAAMLHQFRREPAAVQQLAAEAVAVCAKHGNPYYELWATMLHTWAEAVQGNVGDKLPSIQRTIERFKATESSVRLPFYLSLVVDLCLLVREPEQGLATLREAEEIAAANSESWWTAELHRLRGELLRGQGATPAEVESCFSTSIAVARQQDAKLLELRATVSLARLWAEEGREQEACHRLTPLLDSFTEGWDTPDLQDAQTLLRRLRGDVPLRT